MKNITDLRNELSQVFSELKTGELKPKVATEMNNAAGKIINTVKIQLDYANLRKEKPDIPYLKGK